MKKIIVVLLFFMSGVVYGQMGDYNFTKGIFMQGDSLDGELKEVCRLDSILEVNVVLRKNLLVVKYYEFGTSIFAGGFEVNVDDSWTAEFGDEYIAYSQIINDLMVYFLYCPVHKDLPQLMIANAKTRQALYFFP